MVYIPPCHGSLTDLPNQPATNRQASFIEITFQNIASDSTDWATIPQENGPLHHGKSQKNTDVGNPRLRPAAMAEEERIQALDDGWENLETEVGRLSLSEAQWLWEPQRQKGRLKTHDAGGKTLDRKSARFRHRKVKGFPSRNGGRDKASDMWRKS